MRAFIGLGSNMGDKRQNLKTAINEIDRLAGDVVSRSKIYETAPWGFESPSFFFNMVIEIETTLSPFELLALLLKIEAIMGRKRIGVGYSSRPIDLDILFCDDLIISEPKLTIPHPLISERLFVLKPLNDICPTKKHPITHLSVREMLEQCKDDGNIALCDFQL
ncbi:MAG: 2-amino-4-hydroxy-6-hydroxymethyldihydropteridine diphosphokinase [Bacteroidales bacterium]|nr:2-amino-4-hydroxy-6-hydroxymethyldihydropteridine diphosphokinase [Bacteroidales bacterium]